MALSKEQWAEIERELESPFGRVTLRVDGYAVALAVARVQTRKYAIVIYVNGWFKGEWIMNDCEERRRFMRSMKRYLYSSRSRTHFIKKFGKRAAERHGMYKTFTAHEGHWTSFKALKRHLLAHNENIERIDAEEHERLVAAAEASKPANDNTKSRSHEAR